MATSSNSQEISFEGGSWRCFLCSLQISSRREAEKKESSCQLDPTRPQLHSKCDSGNRILFKYLLSECKDKQFKAILFSSSSTIKFCGPCQDAVLFIRKLHLELEVVQMKLIDKLKQLRKLIIVRSTQDSCEVETDEGLGEQNFVGLASKFHRFIRESDEKRTVESPLIFLKKSIPVECYLKMNPIISAELDADNVTIESDSALKKKNMDDGMGSLPKLVKQEEPMDDECSSDYNDEDWNDNMHFSCSESTSSSDEEIRDIKPPTTKTRGPAQERNSERMTRFMSRNGSRSATPSNPEATSSVLVEGSSSSSEGVTELRKRLPSSSKSKVKCVKLLKHGRKVIFYCCELCSYQCSTRVAFEHHFHLQHETEEKPFECPKCPIKFSVKEALTFHLSFRHSQLRWTVKCNLCGASCQAGQAWKNHLKTKHSDEILFQCDLCGDVFLNFVKLILHSRRHFGAKLKCALCPNSEEGANPLDLQRELPRHLDEVHGVSDLRLVCDVPNCSEIFYLPRYLYNHKRTWHKDKINFHCKTCVKNFSSLSELRAHNAETHPKNKCHKCKLCAAQFKERRALVNHYVREHDHPKFECELCPPPGEIFLTRNGLKGHREACHQKEMEETTFLCSQCPKVFSSDRYRSAHEKTHVLTKDFACDKCGEGFKSRKNLQFHLINRHPASTSKDFCCEKCGFVTASENYLRRHMRKHQPKYECAECHKLFARKRQLTNHTYSHGPEKRL